MVLHRAKCADNDPMFCTVLLQVLKGMNIVSGLFKNHLFPIPPPGNVIITHFTDRCWLNRHSFLLRHGVYSVYLKQKCLSMAKAVQQQSCFIILEYGTSHLRTQIRKEIFTMEENTARKSFSRNGFAQLAGKAATFLIGSFVLVPLASGENLQKSFSTLGASGLLLMMYLPQVAYLLAYWLCVRTMPKAEWQKEKLSFGTLAEIFLMMYAVSTVINSIGSAITKSAPAGGDFQLDLIAKMESSRLPVAIAIPVIIGPIVEELIFRKIMLDRIRPYGEKTAIIFSAVCFGLFHENLTQFLFAGCVGLFLGYVYCKTGKVLYTMIMHMLINGTSTVLLLLLPSGDLPNADAAAISFIGILLMMLVLGIMMILGIIHLIRWIKQKKFVFDESMPAFIPQNEVLKTVYLNPGVLLLLVIGIAEIIATLFNINLPL